ALPTAGLIFLDVVLAALAAALAVVAGWQAYSNRFDPRRSARLIEEHVGIHDNRLINAVDLAISPPGSGSAELARPSVKEGEELAAGLSSPDCVDFPRLVRPAGMAMGMLLFLLVSYLAAPRAFGMIIPRFLDPAGDHPPYTLLRFEVTV